MLKNLVWEKKKNVDDSEWEGLDVGARVLFSPVGGFAQIERLSLMSTFPNDNEAIEALIRNGFAMTLQSVMEIFNQSEEQDLPDWFGRVMSEETKSQIPKRVMEKFPNIFG